MENKELIKKHLEGCSGLQKASIEHFAETGKASGSFFMALEAMLDERAKNVVKNYLSKSDDSRWISVEKRLPNLISNDEDGIVSKLVVVLERDNPIPTIARLEKDEDGDLDWYDMVLEDVFGRNEVTHWMELPNQPKTVL